MNEVDYAAMPEPLSIEKCACMRVNSNKSRPENVKLLSLV